MNESGQYQGESETFRNKYETFLYYTRALLNKIMKTPNCPKEISEKCASNIELINDLLDDYVRGYNMGYGNFGNKKEFQPKDKPLKKLLEDLKDIDIFEN